MNSERIAHRVLISSTGMERRSSRDRRQSQISIFKKLFYRGLRESTRRAEDRNGIIVFDRYKPSLVVSIIIVLSLSLLDALLTLILLSHGAKELNPVMRYYLIETIKSTLASGDDVLVSGFGKFCVNKKKERRGRNPATGDSMMLRPRRVVTFKVSGKLRKKVKGNNCGRGSVK